MICNHEKDKRDHDANNAASVMRGRGRDGWKDGRKTYKNVPHHLRALYHIYLFFSGRIGVNFEKPELLDEQIINEVCLKHNI